MIGVGSAVRNAIIKDGFNVIEAVNFGPWVRDQAPMLIVMDADHCRPVFTQPYSNCPVIVLSSKLSADNAVWWLNWGADDFIRKPFLGKELLARISAILRRESRSPCDHKVHVGDIVVDIDSYVVWMGNVPVSLSRKEAGILCLLASNPGRTFSRDEILDYVWGVDFAGTDRIIDLHIKRLRVKLTACTHVRIEAVWGIGYKLEADDPQKEGGKVKSTTHPLK